MSGRESRKAEPATPAEPVNRAFFIAKETVDDRAGFGSRLFSRAFCSSAIVCGAAGISIVGEDNARGETYN